jgi:hypothetical protein
MLRLRPYDLEQIIAIERRRGTGEPTIELKSHNMS